jgi:hypothetical protein
MDHADDGGNNVFELGLDVFVYMGGDQEVPRNVTHVRVHESVKIIRRRAFHWCIHLVSIEMHDGVEIIEKWAFSQCHSLKRINLAGVRDIRDSAFFCCRALEFVEFGVKLDSIGNWAFACTSLKRVQLPNAEFIGNKAFAACHLLTDMQLSGDLLAIGLSAINDCPRLRRIGIPLKANIISGIDTIFTECHGLSRVNLVGGIHKTISSLLLESWRNEMKDEIDCINLDLPIAPANEKTATIRHWMERVLERIEHFKSEHYALLKEFTTLLELALWNANLDDNVGDPAAAPEGVRVTRGHKKRARKERCITSGASIVIKNVLPFLKLE